MKRQRKSSTSKTIRQVPSPTQKCQTHTSLFSCEWFLQSVCPFQTITECRDLIYCCKQTYAHVEHILHPIMHWRLHLEREEENKENIPWKITLPMTPYKRNLVWFFGPEVPVFCHGVTDLIITMAAEGRLATNNKHPLFTRCDTLLPTSIHTLQLILFGGLPLPLPTSLTQLELAHTDHKFLPGQLPSNLRLLSLRDYEYRTILPGVLPHSLETLIVCGQEHDRLIYIVVYGLRHLFLRE